MPKAGRVDVVWAGELSWEIETDTISLGFTEVFFDGEDILTFIVTTMFVISSFFLMKCGVLDNVEQAAANGFLSTMGSLVGRLAVVLIVGEASVYLKLSVHRNASDSDDGLTNAVAVVYKFASWGLLLTIFVGDAYFAPKCWFPACSGRLIHYPE